MSLRVRAPAIVPILIAVVVGLPTAAAQPLSGIGSTGPSLRGGDERLTREVFAFFRASSIDHMLQRADFSVLSTIAFFALDAKASGHLRRGWGGFEASGWSVWNSPRMDRLIDLAHGHDTRVVLTITRFAWDAEGRQASAQLLSSAAARATLVDEIVHEVVEHGVDGVNIDFEPIPTGQRDNFVTLMRQLRAALDDEDPGLCLTFDATGYIGNYDIARLTANDAADAVFIMGYPYEGPWSDRAGSIAPMAGVRYTVPDTLDAFLARTSPGKIILGVPYFGFEWSTETQGVHSTTRPKGGRYGWPSEVWVDSAMDRAAVHGRRWDAAQKGPWARWQFRNCGSCPLTWRQVHYEDQVSLGLKYDLVNELGLRGAGIWALGYERERTVLNTLLRQKFGAP